MIFIIPGFLRTKDFYCPLAEKLQRGGFNVEIIDLKYNTQGLKKASDIVYQYLTKTPEKDDIIAHSFGGIILKHIIAHRPEINDYISSITFVSVPHGGSWSALFLAMVPTARDILPLGKHIKELINVPLPEATVNFLSESELKVWPRKNGLLRDRIDIVIPDTNHDSIVYNDNFISKVITFIKSKHDRIFLE